MTNLNSKIEWTDCTWNVVTGCTKVSPGCDNCYAERITERFHGKGSFAEIKLHHDRLDAPFHWRKPRRVFVNSMSDLFHDQVPSSFIAAVFDAMRQTPQHTYQILTKRHGRMRSLMRTAVPGEGWPRPNVHLGISVEDQKRADLRIPVLCDTRASVRFLSCEPLLGPIDFAFDHECGDPPHMYCPPIPDWIIVGGESGPGARPCDPTWIWDIIKQCRWSRIPVFVKQLGSVWAQQNGADSKGGNPDYWPVDLRIREFPTAVAA